MKLDPKALAVASATATALVWTLCSLLVFAVPSMMSGMTGHMMHTHMSSFTWMLTFTGYLIGLAAWCVWAAAMGWLIALVYNKVASD